MVYHYDWRTERDWKERSRSLIEQYHPSILLEVLKKTTKILSQEGQ